jgi:hypothetical protein
MPPAVAVIVAFCVLDTAEAVAEKLALVAPAATVTEDGTVTAALVLDKLTATPPEAAAPLSVTVHGSVPGPMIEALLQVTELSTGPLAIPVPFRLIKVVPFVEESLVIDSCPVAAPAAAGLNWMLKL